MKEIVEHLWKESVAVKERFFKAHADHVVAAAEEMADRLTKGHKLFFFGNGGSAADAQHLAAEFVNRFRIERPPLPAIALTTDTSALTAIGNDYGFEQVFTKQLWALASTGDVAVGISTSGDSANVVHTMKAARELEIFTIGLTGGTGGKMAEFCDILLPVAGKSTARIQETHITVGHVICDLIERILFPAVETR